MILADHKLIASLFRLAWELNQELILICDDKDQHKEQEKQIKMEAAKFGIELPDV